MPRRVESRPGEGARLRKELEYRDLSQKDLADACDLSRQTIARLINKDEATDETFDAIWDFLEGGGAGQDPEDAERPPNLAALSATHLVTAAEIDAWRPRRQAQSEFPGLLRRLITSSAPGLSQLVVPSGDAVSDAGWDGLVTVQEGNAWVPAGPSAWEIGTGGTPQVKASSDYAKRSKSPLSVEPSKTTFVFVTSRKWAGRAQWADQRRAEGVWADVRALDATDLEAWLEATPQVHLWATELIGVPITGVQTLRGWLHDVWAPGTSPPMNGRIIGAGRDGAFDEIRKTLGEGGVTFVRAESRDEVVAGIAAALIGDDQSSSPGGLVVTSAERFQTLASTSSHPLVLIAHFDDPFDLARAASAAGHIVYVPLDASDPASSDELNLGRPHRQALVEALEESGVERQKANALARLGRRSMLALRRHLAVGALSMPAWADPGEAVAAASLLIASQWDAANEADLAAIQQMTGRDEEEISALASRWSGGPDPLIRIRGTMHYVVNLDDAWGLLHRYLPATQKRRYLAAASEILGTPSPVLDLDPEERWMAGVMDLPPHVSEHLRSGVAKGLAAAVRTESVLESSDQSARVALRRVLRVATADARSLTALAKNLRPLAEADPDAFLDALLSAPDGTLRGQFQDTEATGFFGPSSPHTHLLWALETLAWCPDYLPRGVLLLGRLGALDPGGKLSNRPVSSLQDIFRPWVPQTGASVAQRFEALDGLRNQHPAVAWDVLLSMLPVAGGSSGRYTPRPEALDCPGPERVPQSDYFGAVSDSVDRLLVDVGTTADRWRPVLRALGLIAPAQATQVLSVFDATAAAADHAETQEMWRVARKTLADFGRYPDAGWRPAGELVEALGESTARIAPNDAIVRNAWLFAVHPDADHPTDYSEWRAELDRRRGAALEDILAGGPDAVVRLTMDPEADPDTVGAALGLVSNDLGATFAGELLATGDASLRAVASAFTAIRRSNGDANWLESILRDPPGDTSASELANLLLRLRADPDAWDLANKAGGEVEAEYWTHVSPFRLDEDLDRALDELIRVGRLYSVVEVLQHRFQAGELAREYVQEKLQVAIEECPSPQEPVSSHYEYAINQLLQQFLNDGVDVDLVARLEWVLSPDGPSMTKPGALDRVLAKDPEFFRDLLVLGYRSDDGDDRVDPDDEQALARARRAYRTLDGWRRAPGTRDDGTIDLSAFDTWIDTARTLAAEAERVEAADRVIGNALGNTAPGPDGVWPPMPVRRLVERLRSRALDQGLEIGRYNSRGVVTRTRGGDQERALAETYVGYATAVQSSHPRTATLLRRIAATYQRDAGREDELDELRDELA